MSNRIYIFLDEGGNFDFSPRGTHHFSLTSVATTRPFLAHNLLDDYKHDCIEYGIDTMAFHCAEDNLHVRKQVFEIICAHLKNYRVDSVVVEKCKMLPSLRNQEGFYSKMVVQLLKFVIQQEQADHIDEIIVITDTIPIQKKQHIIKKAIQQTLAQLLPEQCRYRILHHASKTHFGLQIADYCNWAIFRKWERGYCAHYDQIAHAIRSEPS